MRGKVFPVKGRHHPHPGARLPAPPGTWRPTVWWDCQGGSAGQQSWRRGRRHGFCAILLGGKRQRHRRPDAGSHGPGPALVGGMVWKLPAPRRRDKGCHCQPAAAGPLLQSWQGGVILLGHGMAPGGAWYNDRLKGLVVCTVILEGGCGCGGGVSRYHYFFEIKMTILQVMYLLLVKKKSYQL